MELLGKLGLIVLCLSAPVAWGLSVEWALHRVRTHRQKLRARRAEAQAVETPL